MSSLAQPKHRPEQTISSAPMDGDQKPPGDTLSMENESIKIERSDTFVKDAAEMQTRNSELMKALDKPIE